MKPTELAPDLLASLKQVAEITRHLVEPWWLFGSAAMALHGARPIQVGDIDLLVSRGDAPRLLERLGLPIAPGKKSDRFHSEIFASWATPPLTVEILAGFHVRVGEEWREVQPRSREAVTLPCGTFHVPEVAELIEWCRLFGRPKDFQRMKLLRELPASAGQA